MFKRTFIHFIWLLALVSMLSACGGGEGSPFGTATETTTDTTDTTDTTTGGGDTTTTPTTPSDVSGFIFGNTIIPAGGSTSIQIITVQGSVDSVSAGDVAAFEAMNATVTGEAVINGSLKSYDFVTNASGEATFTISHPGIGNERLTLIFTGENSTGNRGDITLYFGATANAVAQPTEVPANGTSAATLLVNARDAFGVPIANAFVDLSFPTNSFAVAAISSGATDAQGQFTTTITNTVAQLTSVTPIVEELTLNAVPIRFVTTTTASLAETLDIIVRTDNVPANGTDAVSLVIVARDGAGTPVPNIPVNIASDSATAFMNTGSSTGDLFVTGNTGIDGSFEVFITNTTEQTVNITARAVVTSGTDEEQTTTTLEDTQTITFQNPEVVGPGDPVVIQSVSINSLISNPTTPLANGIDTVTMIGQVINSENEPVVGVTVSIIANGGSARFPGSVTTNQGGFFEVVFTDTVAETFTVFAVVGNIVSELQTLTFNVVPAPTETENPAEPGSIVLIASPERQVLDQAITVTAIVRDGANGTGTPMENINVSLSASGGTANTAVLSVASQLTTANGTASFTINNSVLGSFVLTATAQARNGDGALVGATRSDSVTLEFFQTVGNVADLNVTVVNDNQPANVENPITINVVAVDSGGRPVSGVPLLVQVGSNNAVQINPTRGATDDNGFFTTEITATEAERDIAVTFSVEGGVLTETETISFTASTSEEVVPDSIELQVENSPQPADNQSRVTLIVIPRDQVGTPIAGINVRLISDASDALIATAEGTTNELGEFRTTVISGNSVAETFNITAVVQETSGVTIQDTKSVTFIPIAIPVPDTLTINVVNNNQIIGSEGETQIVVLALDANGTPMNNVPIVLSILPGDISTSVIFGASGFEGLTTGNGTFTTTVDNTQAGIFSIVATVRDTTQTSPPVEIVFREPDTGTSPEVSSIELLTSNAQLDSEGNTQGVIITAIIKNAANNLVSGVPVTFAATSGEILPVINEETGCTGTAGISSPSGRACVRLTTQGDSRNRTITVTAEVASNTGEVRTDAIDIQVSGTTISISGENTVILGGAVTLSLALRDSSNAGIAGEALTVTSALGNVLDNPSPVTDASGNATVTITANVGGQDTITVSKGDGSATAAAFTLTISADDFTLVPNPDPAVTEVSLGTPQEFLVTWLQAGVPQVNQQINLSSTRGAVPATVLTDFNGQARFTITADNAGVATITATAAATGGPSRQIQIEFIATVPASITVQANPATLSVNLADSETLQQSDITAVVRDAANNLVKNQRVTFNLDDITGGSISPASAITDSFGRAATVYTSGASPSAANGVRITASVTENPAINATVELTVARRAAFVSIGAGNTLEKLDGRRYASNFTVLVTDVNGLPIADAAVDLSIYPQNYYKGGFDITGQFVINAICDNEDRNRNALLDTGEDFNNNTVLDPGNVITIGLQESSVDQIVTTLTTDANGFGDFQIVYAIEYALYLLAEVSATVTVEGSEAIDIVSFSTDCLADDATSDPPSCPARVSPFGFGLNGLCSDTL